jgi:hypothetical protein
MGSNKVPISDAIIVAVASIVDDAQTATREPSHSDIEFQMSRAGLGPGDPKNQGQTVGKAKRVRAALYWGLGTRSALDWIVDQYRYEKDSEGNVLSDPNDPADDKYIVHLIERVTTISIETLALIAELPKDLEFTASKTGKTVRA